MASWARSAGMPWALALPHPAGAFPWATLVVNVTAALLMGLLVALPPRPARVAPPGAARRRRGLLGGLTTFSAFAIDVVTLPGDGSRRSGCGIRAASFLGGVAGRDAGIGCGTAPLAVRRHDRRLLVALGAAVGAPLRYAVTTGCARAGARRRRRARSSSTSLGSFVLGRPWVPDVDGAPLALVGTGFCGALTTLSTLALEL